MNTTTEYKISETDFNMEELRHILRYAAYAERCAIKNEVPLTFRDWKEIAG